MDSGGPTMYGNVIIGITIGGRECGTGSPDINTNIQAYMNWIMSVTFPFTSFC